MSNTTTVKATGVSRWMAVFAFAMFTTTSLCQAAPNNQETNIVEKSQSTSQALTSRQQAIIPIAAFAAAGDTLRLSTALDQGLETGLTVNELKEVLVQVYAYAGFPRSLNALDTLMKVLDARKQRGLQDALGRTPIKSIPVGEALLAAGAANQSKLIGTPLRGGVFEFSPAIDEYLKAHLFGAIFERDNFDWQSRELATISMLSALSGVEAQIQAHMRISINIGISPDQLRQLVKVLRERVGAENEQRASAALDHATAN